MKALTLLLALAATPALAVGQQCYVDYLKFRMIWPGSPQLSVFVDDFDPAAGTARVGVQHGLWQICGGRSVREVPGRMAVDRLRDWERADARPPGDLVGKPVLSTTTLDSDYSVAVMRVAYQVKGSAYRRTRFHLVLGAPDGSAAGGEMSCTVTTNTDHPSAGRLLAELEAILQTIHIAPIPGVPACLR